MSLCTTSLEVNESWTVISDLSRVHVPGADHKKAGSGEEIVLNKTRKLI